MRKRTICKIIVLVVIGVIARGVYLHVTSLPDYKLNEIVNEVRQEGIEAVEPYLDSSLKKAYQTAAAIVNAPVSQVQEINAAMRDSKIWSLFKGFESWKWNLKDIEYGKNTVSFVIEIAGEGFCGDINLIMVQKDSEWLIEDISIPVASWLF